MNCVVCVCTCTRALQDMNQSVQSAQPQGVQVPPLTSMQVLTCSFQAAVRDNKEAASRLFFFFSGLPKVQFQHRCFGFPEQPDKLHSLFSSLVSGTCSRDFTCKCSVCRSYCDMVGLSSSDAVRMRREKLGTKPCAEGSRDWEQCVSKSKSARIAGWDELGVVLRAFRGSMRTGRHLA